MAMKVYIAAPFIEKDRMPEISKRLEGMGLEVTHKWWQVEGLANEDEKCSPLEMRKHAELDRDGVKAADLVLLINSSKSEGKAVEQGIALANNIPIIAVGKLGEHSKNVFHYMGLYHWVDDIDKAYTVIEFIEGVVRG